jgi:hypothetical protein
VNRVVLGLVLLFGLLLILGDGVGSLMIMAGIAAGAVYAVRRRQKQAGSSQFIGSDGQPLTRVEEEAFLRELHGCLERSWQAICRGSDSVEVYSPLTGPDVVPLFAKWVGPAFEVYWRTAQTIGVLPSGEIAEVQGGKLVIERDPSMHQPVSGIPTEDGRIIVDPTNEPAWMTRTRNDPDWELIIDDRLNPDGTINVSYRPKLREPQQPSSWWRRLIDSPLRA